MDALEFDIEVKRSSGYPLASHSPVYYPVAKDKTEERAAWRKAQRCIYAWELTPAYEIEMLNKFDMLKWLTM